MGLQSGINPRGFNVKYASDPYWGQKLQVICTGSINSLVVKILASIRIGETNTTDLNVRHEPEVTSKPYNLPIKNQECQLR